MSSLSSVLASAAGGGDVDSPQATQMNINVIAATMFFTSTLPFYSSIPLDPVPDAAATAIG